VVKCIYVPPVCENKNAVLSQGEPHDAAVNFYMYQILYRHLTWDFPATAQPSCWSFSADCQKSDKY